MRSMAPCVTFVLLLFYLGRVCLGVRSSSTEEHQETGTDRRDAVASLVEENAVSFTQHSSKLALGPSHSNAQIVLASHEIAKHRTDGHKSLASHKTPTNTIDSPKSFWDGHEVIAYTDKTFGDSSEFIFHVVSPLIALLCLIVVAMRSFVACQNAFEGESDPIVDGKLASTPECQPGMSPPRMSASKTDELEAAGPLSVTLPSEQQLLSFQRLNSILCFNFANGVLLASYMLLVLPMESQRMNYNERSIVLGSLMFIAGVTQLINPMVGLLSDRCTSLWGRRRPFIVVGGIVGMAGIMAQEVASSNQHAASYYIAYTISMLGLNTAYTAVVGIMADLVPKAQTGTATGIAALHTVVGANVGFVVFYNIPGSKDAHLSGIYMTYVIITGLCVIVTFLTVNEIPLTATRLGTGVHVKDSEESGEDRSWLSIGKQRSIRGGSSSWLTTPLIWTDVLDAYYIDPRKHYDFSVVFCSRTFYYFGVSVQTFFKYYLKDVVGIEDAESAIVKTAIIGQLCAAATAIPTGLLSDRLPGAVRKPFIYAACAVLSIGNVANLFVRSEADVLVICGCLGAANGVYLAMDAALALDTLPSHEEAARFMGLWGIGCFLGGAIGPVMGGPILALFGHNPDKPSAYNYSGYAILLAMAAIAFLFSGIILRRVGAQPVSHDVSDMTIELGCQERSLNEELVMSGV